MPSTLGTLDAFVLNLHTPDFTTATRLADRINEELGGDVAETIDPVSVRVRAPTAESERVAFISHLENLEIEAARRGRAGDHQLAHRHRRDRRQRAGQPGGRRRTARSS